MSDAPGSRVTETFAALFGSDPQRWNHDQHKVAARVDELLLESSIITESDLMKRINQLVTDNPGAYRTDGTGETLNGSRYLPNRLFHSDSERVRD